MGENDRLIKGHTHSTTGRVTLPISAVLCVPTAMGENKKYPLSTVITTIIIAQSIHRPCPHQCTHLWCTTAQLHHVNTPATYTSPDSLPQYLCLSLLSQIVPAPGPIGIQICGRKIIYNVKNTAISPQLLNGPDLF